MNPQEEYDQVAKLVQDAKSTQAQNFYATLNNFDQVGCLKKMCEEGNLDVLKALLPILDAKSSNSSLIRHAAYNAQEQMVLFLIPHSQPEVVEQDVLLWCAFNGLQDAFDRIAKTLPTTHIEKISLYAQDGYSRTNPKSSHNAPGKLTHEEVMERFAACLSKRGIVEGLPDIDTSIHPTPRKI